MLDRCIPGDVVEVVGVLKSMQTDVGYVRRGGGGKGGAGAESGIHQLYILANSLTSLSKQTGNTKKRSRPGELGDIKSTDGDPGTSRFADTTSFSEKSLRIIQSIALNEHCLGLLVGTLCPLIFGHELVKLGLLLGLVGAPSDSEVENSNDSMQALSSSNSSSTQVPAVNKVNGDSKEFVDDTSDTGSVRTRSNVHVLIVGDPGLGKSQMLRAAAKVAPRAVW